MRRGRPEDGRIINQRWRQGQRLPGGAAGQRGGDRRGHREREMGRRVGTQSGWLRGGGGRAPGWWRLCEGGDFFSLVKEFATIFSLKLKSF